MRYLRIYIVINALMAGVVRASEMTSVEGVPAVEGIAAGEEPPQQMQDPDSQSAMVPESSPVGDMPRADAVVLPDSASQALESQPQSALAAESGQQGGIDDSAVQDPTIQDAEKEEQQVANSPQPFDVSGMPGQSIFAPTIDAPMMPESPALSAPQELPAVAPQEEQVRGLDTVDLQQPQGNWLFKKYWWNNAQEEYQKIKDHIRKIDDMHLKFNAKRTELDKQLLDPFYAEIGISQSDLQRSMQSLMSQLEQEREKQGMLSEEERELVDAVAKDRERLERLEKDVAAVGMLRDEADRAVDRFMAQKNRAVGLDKEAWEYVREIGRIVNDQQANALYYKVNGIRKTVKDINKHVELDLNHFFDQLFTNAREQIDRIKSTLQALKEQGIDLKARVHDAQEHDLAKEIAPVEEDKDKKAATTPQKTGWFASGSRLFQAAIDVALWQFLQSIWDAVMWLPRRIYSTISSIFR